MEATSGGSRLLGWLWWWCTGRSAGGEASERKRGAGGGGIAPNGLRACEETDGSDRQTGGRCQRGLSCAAALWCVDGPALGLW